MAEIDVKAEMEKVQAELQQLQGQLQQIEQTRQNVASQILMRQGILMKLQEFDGKKPEKKAD